MSERLKSEHKPAKMHNMFAEIYMTFWIRCGEKHVIIVDPVNLKNFQTSTQLLANFGFDTAENDPLKVCQKLAKS